MLLFCQDLTENEIVLLSEMKLVNFSTSLLLLEQMIINSDFEHSYININRLLGVFCRSFFLFHK